MKKLLSVIVPCYNEELAVPYFYREIVDVASKMNELVEFEFLFINDGSSDNTLSILRQYASEDKRVRYVSFSRNFGKEAAIYAGLCNANGDYIVFMDADLQDPPSLLTEMYNVMITEGYDSVGTRRVTRSGEPPIRSFFARMFYKIINKMSKVEMVDGARDYRLMTRQMADSIISMREYNQYSKGLFSFVGFKTKWIEFENTERVAGETKWSFWSLFKYAIEGIISFSVSPLAFSSIFGIITCLISFVMIIYIVLRTLIWGDPVDGWASTICVILFMGSIQLMCTGILGQYLAKNYLESKQRPIYIIKESEKDL